jgi:hypothetical protein
MQLNESCKKSHANSCFSTLIDSHPRLTKAKYFTQNIFYTKYFFDGVGFWNNGNADNTKLQGKKTTY